MFCPGTQSKYLDKIKLEASLLKLNLEVVMQT